MHRFLANNRKEILARCRTKLVQRTAPAATGQQLGIGLPLFLEQLIRTLQAEREGHPQESLRISGSSEGSERSEIGVSAGEHGQQLLELGYSIDQVVHSYGDMCQAITDLALVRGAPVSIDEFRTLNRCLDNAIADAVTEFSVRHAAAVSSRLDMAFAERLGFLVHELRNGLQTASLALAALESGKLPSTGATSAVLRRSLVFLTHLVTRSIDEVRHVTEPPSRQEVVSIATLVAQASDAAQLQARARTCPFTVINVEAGPRVWAASELLLAALSNLLQNAFKYTAEGTEVVLHAHPGEPGTVCIDVSDHCGGLPAGATEVLFRPFQRKHVDPAGLGLGLSIARQNVEDAGGALTVRDVPGVGCVFTISLKLLEDFELPVAAEPA